MATKRRAPGENAKLRELTKKWAEGLVNDETYKDAFLKAWRKRDIPHQLEALVHHYYRGKPADEVRVKAVSQWPDEELDKKISELLDSHLGDVLKILGTNLTPSGSSGSAPRSRNDSLN